MTNELAAIAAGGLGAFVGAALTVVFTLPRIRRERGFDRRLMWCESMMKALNTAGAAVTSATNAENAALREACWTQAIRAYEQLIPICAQKELYAPCEGVEAIQSFMEAFKGLIKSHLNSHCTASPAENYDSCLGELRQAAASLALIARGHLGLEKLPREMIERPGRFLGSFRGHDLGEHRDALQ